jgi:hypothetical protein
MQASLSRKIDTPHKQIALVAFLVVVLLTFLFLAINQKNDIDIISSIDTTEVVNIQIAGNTIIEEASIAEITSAMNDVRAFTFQQGGCYRPTRMVILLHSDKALQLAVAVKRDERIVLIQIIEDNLPPCIYGRPMYSKALLQVLINQGISI